jgi:hypothetical protein
MTQHRSVRRAGSEAAPVAALIAAALGIGHAAVSAYWAVGGTWLLDTIGGELERWGRERQPSVVVALWLIAVLKAGGRVGGARPRPRAGAAAGLDDGTCRPRAELDRGRGAHRIRRRPHCGRASRPGRRHTSRAGKRSARPGLARVPVGSVVLRLGCRLPGLSLAHPARAEPLEPGVDSTIDGMATMCGESGRAYADAPSTTVR